LKTPFTKSLTAIKLFKLNTSVREAEKQRGISYKTVSNIHSLIRIAIFTTDAKISSFSDGLKGINRTLKGEGRENADVGRRTRSLYSAFWKERGM
jgi:hypothetical protein